MDREEIQSLLTLPLAELLRRADEARHRAVGDEIELCSIMNAKSGRCAEDCKFCAQSARHATSAPTYPLKGKPEMLEAARRARDAGAARFDLVTSGNQLTVAEVARIADAVSEITATVGIAMCASLGKLSEESLALLKRAGLSRYHHNIETSPAFYPRIVASHRFEERLETICAAQRVGLQVCSGGIIGMGESWQDRIDMALVLKELDVTSVPLNVLVPIPGTPFEGRTPISGADAMRTIALFRLILPDKIIKIAAGRESVLKDFQAMAFLAGANGMLIGGYLTLRGRDAQEDRKLVEEVKAAWRQEHCGMPSAECRVKNIRQSAFGNRQPSLPLRGKDSFVADAESFLRQRRAEGLLRELHPISARRDGRVRIEGKSYLDLSSNDYLGLAEDPRLAEAAKQATDAFGTSACASRLMSGDLDLHHLLEEHVAAFKSKPGALVFNSGYQANVGIFSALLTRDDAVFSDRLNHASILDGIRLSGARLFRFRHNDPGHLETLLKKERPKCRNALIATETIFSMDGDRAPLRELVELKERHDCRMLVDEAHATGLFGKTGAGVVEEDGLADRIDLVMGTFSKALASFGAYVATSRPIVDCLVNRCRSFIYSTALPPAVIACNMAGLTLVAAEPWRRETLREHSGRFREALREKGFRVGGASQIVPVILGENEKAVAFAKALQAKGYWVLPVRPPTVPQGEARLRITLTARHSWEVLSQLADDIANVRV